MTAKLPYLIALFALLALAFFAGRGCIRDVVKHDSPAEQQQARSVENRTKQHTTDSLARQHYQELAARQQARIKALQADSVRLTSKDKAATEKAAHSAAAYGKTPTLVNCNHALNDCKQENHAKAAVIANRDSTVKELRQLDKIKATEIGRQSIALDSAFSGWGNADRGWQEANVNNARISDNLAKEKGKKWSVGVGVHYGLTPVGPQPSVSIGIQRTLFRF